jgi:hypothetical protein
MIGNGHDYQNLVRRAVILDIDSPHLHMPDLAVHIAVKEETRHNKDLAALSRLRRTLAEKAEKNEEYLIFVQGVMPSDNVGFES